MTAIVCVSKSWGIGRDGALLFLISDDHKRFRSLTVGKTVILGHKTLDTFPGGRPLKDRRNIVLSHRDLDVPGAEIDLSGCPDLGPVLFALCAALGHGGVFTGTRRLRIKESDRAAVMAQTLKAFGIETELYDNEVIIKPGALKAPAGTLPAHNDHRIVMAEALLCSITGGIIDGVQAVRKSYPNYFADLGSLGLEAEDEA